MSLHSIRLPHQKSSAEMQTAKPLLPPKVVISMSQHGGVPCTPLVQVGDDVKTGQEQRFGRSRRSGLSHLC